MGPRGLFVSTPTKDHVVTLSPTQQHCECAVYLVVPLLGVNHLPACATGETLGERGVSGPKQGDRIFQQHFIVLPRICVYGAKRNPPKLTGNIHVINAGAPPWESMRVVIVRAVPAVRT